MTRLMLLVLAAITAAPGVALGQDGGSVFISGPVEWSPSVVLRDFGYDDNIFLESAGRAMADFTGTLSPTVGARIANPRLELTSSATADIVYFKRYAEQRAINQRYAGRAAVTVSLFQPFVAGEWQRVRDRLSPEVDLRARRLSRQTTVGVGLFSLSRTSLSLSWSRNEVDYEAGQVFGAVDLATQLNRSSEVASVGIHFAITPLTSLTASGSLLHESYPFVTGKDQKGERVSIAVEFAPDAAIRGHAMLGYSRLTVEDAAAVPFAGLTTDVDVSYSILDVTQLKVRYNRETAASIREPYYVQTLYGIDVQQAFFGPFGLVARATRQQLDYPGLPSRGLAGHLDYLSTYAAGFIVRLTGGSWFDTSYEIGHRQSTDVNLRYQRRRVITSVSLGF